MSVGGDLEAAIATAAKHYERADVAEIHKQHTPQAHGVGYSGKAPVDFRGWYRDAAGNRAPIVLEVKATEEPRLSFAADGHLMEHQVLEIVRNVERGIACWLVVDFTTEREVYRVAGRHLAEFYAAPWRKSLPLFWCRALGELCRESDRDGRHRAVWFLEGKPHPLREGAEEALRVDHDRARGQLIELYPAESKPSKKLHARFENRPAPGTPEHREYVRRLADEGLKRQMGAKPRAFGRRKKTKGWI